MSCHVRLLKSTDASASVDCWLRRLLGGSVGCRDPLFSSSLCRCSAGTPAGRCTSVVAYEEEEEGGKL